jgi:CubicO group peptidase (beta-lactamase class C family)
MISSQPFTRQTATLLIATAVLNSSIANIAHAQGEIQTAPTPVRNKPDTADNTSAADLALRQEIDSLVIQRIEEQRIPGYAISVIKDGRLIIHNAYGFQNLEQRRPATNQTAFGLASLTKTFTAFCLLTLADQGLIELDAPLDKYLTGLGDEYKKLTIRQLASMVAGVPSSIGEQLPWTRQCNQLVHTPLVSEPGSQYLYSNYSYRLLGSVIESVTGKPYLQYVSETMLIPFGMSKTGTTDTLAQTGLVAQVYGDNNGSVPPHPIPFRNPATQFSAGMLESTSDDMLRYAEALLSRRGLSSKSYQTMWYERPALTTGEPSKWAFGWASKIAPTYGNARTVSMNGGVPGVASTMIILPEKNSCVVALCNLRKPAVYKIATEVATLAFGNRSERDGEQEAEGPGDGVEN